MPTDEGETTMPGLAATVRALERLVETLEERMTRHEENCIRAYGEANASREHLRLEVTGAIGKLGEQMDAATYWLVGLLVTFIAGLLGALTHAWGLW